MKKFKLLLVSFLILATISTVAQEGAKFNFDKGTLKICSSKNFVVKGYDGNEVVVKNLNPEGKNYRIYTSHNDLKDAKDPKAPKVTRSVSSTSRSYSYSYGVSSHSDSTAVHFFPRFSDENERSEGLKKLGKKAEAQESGIYLKIEQEDGQLTISDDVDNTFVMFNDEKYELLIPNTLKLVWDTNGCESKSSRRTMFYSTSKSELKDFKGEVEITSTLNNMNLIDVSGPVTVNTIGGNVIVEFVKTTPNKLYSIYSNNGFIDIKLPRKSNVTIDAKGEEIMSDLDFNITKEEELHGAQYMNLVLGNGNVKMKLDAGYGNIYLRKAE